MHCFLGQPDDAEIAASDRCVIQTGAGCWAVRHCDDANERLGDFNVPTNIICEVDIRESQPTKKELLTYIQVLRENVKEITKDCKRCKGVDPI